MAGITLTQAQAKLDLWMEAEEAVARNQSYSINGRSLTRADAGEITEKIKFWESKVVNLQRGAAGRSRVRYGVAE